MIINEFLQDLTKVPNMQAIAVYGVNNTLLDSWTVYDSHLQKLNEISLHYFQIFSILHAKGKNFKEVLISHDNGQIYALILPDLLFIILTKLPTDISLIRLIINVSVSEILGSRTVQKLLKKTREKHLNFFDKKYLDESEKELLKKIGI